jgi:hypothetical protein
VRTGNGIGVMATLGVWFGLAIELVDENTSCD